MKRLPIILFILMLLMGSNSPLIAQALESNFETYLDRKGRTKKCSHCSIEVTEVRDSRNENYTIPIPGLFRFKEQSTTGKIRFILKSIKEGSDIRKGLKLRLDPNCITLPDFLTLDNIDARELKGQVQNGIYQRVILTFNASENGQGIITIKGQVVDEDYKGRIASCNKRTRLMTIPVAVERLKVPPPLPPPPPKTTITTTTIADPCKGIATSESLSYLCQKLGQACDTAAKRRLAKLDHDKWTIYSSNKKYQAYLDWTKSCPKYAFKYKDQAKAALTKGGARSDLERAWKKTKETNTIEAYLSFRAKYPNHYIAEVALAIVKLTPMSIQVTTVDAKYKLLTISNVNSIATKDLSDGDALDRIETLPSITANEERIKVFVQEGGDISLYIVDTIWNKSDTINFREIIDLDYERVGNNLTYEMSGGIAPYTIKWVNTTTNRTLLTHKDIKDAVYSLAVDSLVHLINTSPSLDLTNTEQDIISVKAQAISYGSTNAFDFPNSKIAIPVLQPDSSKLKIIIGLGILLLMTLAGGLVFFFFLRKRKKEKEKKQDSLFQ